MTSLDHDRLMQVLAEAMELPPPRRAGFLDSTCIGEPHIRQRIDEMLEFAPRAAELFDAAADSVFSEDPHRIGLYTIVEPVGEGGMAIVYKARQDRPVKRTVAIKLIKLGMDTKQFVTRFEAERQALAMMDHPSVAKVFEAGATETGRPYFVMEYVAGSPIVEYSDRNRLGMRERLELFTSVCDAVEHAHRKGILHRDIKSSNVLVSEVDGKPLPKVIDFGIAKALQHPLTDRTLHTEQGQLIGTPEYMSPEQAERGAMDIDTRSDVYALGVLLYELISGVPAIASKSLRGGSYEQVRRFILENEPQRPSTRLGALSAEQRMQVAQNRQMPLPTLIRQLRSELEWIPLKAMRKNRDERYRSAAELADDIQNYLLRKPLIAGPESGWYRARKFVRRNRGPVSAAALIVLTMAGGLLLAMTQRNEARRQQALAQSNAAGESAARARAEAITAFVIRALQSGDPHESGSQSTTIAQAMRAALKEIHDGALKSDPQTEAGLKSIIANIFQGNGLPREAESLAQDVLQSRRKMFPGDHADVATSLNDLAAMKRQLGQLSEAEALFRESLEMRRRLFPADHPDVGLSLSNLAMTQLDFGRASDAELLSQQSLDMFRKLHAGDHPDIAIRLGNLASIKTALGRPAEAEPLLVEALEMRRRLHHTDHPELAKALNNLGFLRMELARYDESEPLLVEAMEMYRRMFAGDHPDLAQSIHNVASVRHQVGRSQEAEPLYLEALRMRQRLYPGDHPEVAANLADLGFVYSSMDKLNEAEPYVRAALEMYQRMFQGDHPNVASALNNLASTWLDLGRADDAEPLFVQALQMRRALFGEHADNPSVALSLNNLARCRVKLGRIDDADRDASESVQMYERLFPNGHPRRAVALSTLAMVRHAQRRQAEAEQILAQAQAMLLRTETLDGLNGRKLRQAIRYVQGNESGFPATKPATVLTR